MLWLDYNILRSTEWINDNIIYAAQSLLKKQFGICGGLQSTQYGHNLSFKVLPLNSKYVQILHVNNNHWVMVSNIDPSLDNVVKDRVLIYDSLVPKKICQDIKRQICSFTRPVSNKFMFDVMNVMPQVTSYDCGLHAIASATEILHGRNPSKCLWDTSQMRKHLMKCFEKQMLTPFPILRERRIAFGGAVKVYEEEPIYCVCRMPYDKNCVDMIQCSMCMVWYHSSCVKIVNVKDFKNKEWLCVKCNDIISA